MLLTIPNWLWGEAGVKFSPGLKPKERMLHIFERYFQGSSLDHYFQTWEIESQGLWQAPQYRSRLVTPSMFNWTFLGDVRSSRQQAEDSAIEVFLQDKRVVEIASKVPPTAKKVRKWLIAQMPGPTWKDSLQARGIDKAIVVEEAKQELFSQFRSAGCRTAISDGMA